MPNRILRNNICDSEKLNAISAEAERLYYRLMVNADDKGRFEATPLVVGTACFPRMFQSDDESEILKNCRLTKAWLSELSTVGLVALYESEGRRYLVFYKWEQRLDRVKVRYPEPPENLWETNGKPNGNQQETKRPAETETETETETEVETETVVRVTLEQVEEVYQAYPKKVAKPEALKAIKKVIKEFGFEHILKQTKAYAAAYMGDRQYIPYPATWFNAHRFNDDPSTWNGGKASPQPSQASLGSEEWRQSL